VIRPGTMTLLLGAPGAGKSSLLKALTGRLKNQADLKGDVTYSGLTVKGLSEAGLHLGQLVQYVSQARVAMPSRLLRSICRAPFSMLCLDGLRRAPGDRRCWHMCCISTRLSCMRAAAAGRALSAPDRGRDADVRRAQRAGKHGRGRCARTRRRDFGAAAPQGARNGCCG